MTAGISSQNTTPGGQREAILGQPLSARTMLPGASGYRVPAATPSWGYFVNYFEIFGAEFDARSP